MAKLVIGTHKVNATAAIVKNSGITPEGTINITESGTYDVTNYASADVDIEGAPEYYIEKTISNGKLSNTTKLIKLEGFTDVNGYALCGEYFGLQFSTGTAIEFTNLSTLSGQYAMKSMFQESTRLSSVSFPALTTIEQSAVYGMNAMFGSCASITSVNFPVLSVVAAPYSMQSMFGGGSGIATVSFPALTTISGSNAMSGMFSFASFLTTVSFPVLTTISGSNALENMFSNTAITSLEFPELTTISAGSTMNSMCSNCTSLTTVKMNKLSTITSAIASTYSQTFGGCTKLENVEFGGLTSATFASAKNQFGGLFNSSTGSASATGCTVHFPSNFDPENASHTFDASTLTGYPRFGGNASYIHIAYDLPATE